MRPTQILSAAVVTGLTTLAVGCGLEEARSGGIWDPEASTSGDGGDDGGTAGAGADGGDDADGDGDGGDDAPDPPDPDGSDDTTDDGGEESTGGVPIDCSPAWTTAYIGSPCAGDTDCPYDGGFCLDDNDGFPCGTCSLSCAQFCRDAGDAPTTYCVDGSDVGLASNGYCLSQCDVTQLGGDGCRDGYVCNVLSRYDLTGAAPVCIPAEFDNGTGDLVSVIDHAFLIEHFGGTVVDPNDYGPDLDSFQMYLDDVGVQHTSAAEFAEPYNPAAAAMCGFSLLLPERDQWEKAAALGMFTDVLTELVGEPIFVRNWWRPDCYNEAVGGAPGGDHPDADALDLDFSSEASRAMAQQFLCNMYWNEDIVPPEDIDPLSGLDPRLNMSVGLGGVTIHLGLLSAGGRRFWYYASYTDEPASGDCW